MSKAMLPVTLMKVGITWLVVSRFRNARVPGQVLLPYTLIAIVITLL